MDITDYQYRCLIHDTAESGRLSEAYDMMFNDSAMRAEIEADGLTAAEMLERINQWYEEET